MTENEWLESTDLSCMVRFMRGRTSERKLRLFAVACCQRHRRFLTAEALETLAVAERTAERLVSAADRQRSRASAFHLGWLRDPVAAHRRGPAKAAVCESLSRRAWEAAIGAAWHSMHIGALENRSDSWEAARQGQREFLAKLLRCIVGNPFQPEQDRSPWKTAAVHGIAQGIYTELAFDRLPELAMELVDAGCRDLNVLDHCRDSGPHDRGCWVIDLLLGKR